MDIDRIFRISRISISCCVEDLDSIFKKSNSCFLEDIGPTLKMLFKDKADLQDCSARLFSNQIKAFDSQDVEIAQTDILQMIHVFIFARYLLLGYPYSKGCCSFEVLAIFLI